MRTGMLAASVWLAVLGYWILYHGVQTLSTIGQSASSSTTTTGTGGPDPWAYLKQQPTVIR